MKACRWLVLIPVFMMACFATSCSKSASKKAYTIGIDKSFFPLNLMEQEKNVYGFTHDVLSYIGNEKGLDMALLPLNWDNILPSLKDKKVDAIITAMKPYVFYLNNFSFSDLYLATGPVLLEPANVKPSSLDELNGKIVGVIATSEYSLIIEKHPNLTVTAFNTTSDLLDALANKSIDAALLDALIASSYCRDLYQGKFQMASCPLTDDGLRVMTLKDEYSQLITTFNEELQSMQKSGKLKEIAQKWSIEVSCPSGS